MTEILPGLHWIEGRASNVYLYESESGLILFDTGLRGDVDKIENYIQKIGRSITDLKAIFITHADIDHAAGAATLQKRAGALIYAAPESAALLTKGQSPQHMPRLIQFIIDKLITYDPLPPQTIRPINEGVPIPELDEWQILATPGHTMDHHAFFNLRQGILIAGDALNTRNNTLNCTPPRITADMPAAHQSAHRLLRLTPAVFACGHGKPFQAFTAMDIMNLDRQLS